jgi:hypothetical protein
MYAPHGPDGEGRDARVQLDTLYIDIPSVIYASSQGEAYRSRARI